MRQRVFQPVSLFFPVPLSDAQWEKIEQSISKPLPNAAREQLQQAIDRYLQSVYAMARSRPPREAREELVKLKKMLLAIDKTVAKYRNGKTTTKEALEIDDLNMIRELDIPIDLNGLFIEVDPSVAEREDLIFATISDVENKFLEMFNHPIDMMAFFSVSKIIEAIDSLHDELKGKTGRPGDPFFSVLVEDALKIFNEYVEPGRHSKMAHSFIFAVNNVIRDCLKKSNLKVAGAAALALTETSVGDWVRGVAVGKKSTD